MMNIKKIKKNKGFVLLFVIVISSIILAITLSIMNISLKEIKFGTSARDTNDAFFAADAGSECALFNDKSTQNKFPLAGPAVTITCANVSILPVFSSGVYRFTVANLGSMGQSCAIVTVDKSVSPVSVISKGYNVGDASCLSSSANRVERELQMTFVANSVAVATYDKPQSMGNRNSLITITGDTIWNYNGYPNTNALDGNYSTTTYTTTGLVSIAGHYTTFDFGTAIIIQEARYWWFAGGPQSFTAKWQGSNNNSTWTDLSADFPTNDGSNNPVVLGNLNSNTTAYRYYRWMGVSGTAYNNGGMSEIEFKIK
ncbi:MAG: hypothetical protein NT161_00820 [Candidatus Nomurabacteria bacterium]|nr:hypothetical protein [Candidatus Nomurabacteria bacterium]